MKKVMMTLVVALVGFNASASMVENYFADLKTFSFQKDSELETSVQHMKVTGTVSITPISDISVSIQRDIICAKNHFCPAIIYPAIVYQVPMTERKMGACNEQIFTGSVDNRLVDGTLTKITVVDNTSNTCETFVALPATSVLIEVEGGGRANLHESHTMTGEQLRELM